MSTPSSSIPSSSSRSKGSMMATAPTRAAQPTALFDYKPYWAECFGIAPMLPMNRADMDELQWDSCDVILVTGDAYVDHPSFGMAIVGRLLEAQGFRVGIIAQPDWQNTDAFTELGRPNLFFGVTAGNMDSMINRYTADRKIRNDDAYTPNDIGGKRPDRSSIVYSQRCREAYPDSPIILGGIEASLRRIAHYDYWQDEVRRSILADSHADMLVYGNGERAIVDIAHRFGNGDSVDQMTDIRGTAYFVSEIPTDWTIVDSTNIDKPGRVERRINPYEEIAPEAACEKPTSVVDQDNSFSTQAKPVKFFTREERQVQRQLERDKTVLRLPGFNVVKNNSALYAHANRVLHLETNPGNARALFQNQGDGKKLWINAPPIPLTTEEMDYVFDQPFARVPHPSYGSARIPAYEMIRFSVNIMRGCFGGCTFCSITEHEGRIIQSRSEDSIVREVEAIRDKVPGFTGVVSDLGGPTANMYRLACKSKKVEQACRKPSCVFPGICSNLNTDHSSLIQLYRKTRELPGIKKVLISSGLRYDLAVESPEYVEELVTHHVGGYLKIAPEHTERGPLDKMMKPGIGSYDKFKSMFEAASKKAGKEQYLIPYFIAAHPGTTDKDMMNLALWLKRNGFKADQVQNFYPSPMATATTMYHTGKNPLKKIKSDSEEVEVPKSAEQRRLHKAFLRYHDPNNWPMLRAALRDMKRDDLIGNGENQLIPSYQPRTDGGYESPRRKNSSTSAGKRGSSKRNSQTNGRQSESSRRGSKGKVAQGTILTQHTGLPPRETE